MLITTQVILINHKYGPYNRSAGRNWINLFYPEDDAGDNPLDFHYYIYTINEALEDSNKLVNNYFVLPNTSVDALAIATAIGQDPERFL